MTEQNKSPEYIAGLRDCAALVKYLHFEAGYNLEEIITTLDTESDTIEELGNAKDTKYFSEYTRW